MKLLGKKEYNFVEQTLRTFGLATQLEEPFESAKKEIVEFFNISPYDEFLQLFYFNRHEYRNRYRDNRSMFTFLCKKLYVQESTLYMMRKEIVYKSAMILYKYNILQEFKNEF